MADFSFLDALGLGGLGAGGILGGIAGGQGTGNQQSQNFNVNAQLSPLGGQAQYYSSDALERYRNLAMSQSGVTQMGPQQYAQLLAQYAQSGGLPNQQQVGYANQYAQNIFAPQQAQLNNVFQQAQQNTNRQAASLGRPVNDPILQAKLAQYQGQQQSVLGAQQGALASQFAQQLPQQQLGYAKMLNDQAFQNQQNVLGLGQSVLQNQQNYALGSANRSGTMTGQSGGGLAGTLSGLLTGASGGMNMFNTLGSLFGGGGAGGLGLGGTDALLGAGGIGGLGAGDLLLGAGALEAGGGIAGLALV